MAKMKAGTSTDFADSMVEAMENAFQQEWANTKSVPLPEGGEEDRRLLFTAIAQGFVRHLVDTASDSVFVDDVSVMQDTVSGDGNRVKSDGSVISAGHVEVVQDSDNVTSSGSGKGVRIETRGDLYS